MFAWKQIDVFAIWKLTQEMRMITMCLLLFLREDRFDGWTIFMHSTESERCSEDTTIHGDGSDHILDRVYGKVA